MQILELLAPYAPVVVVPLGLALLSVPRRTLLANIPAALFTALSFAFDQGWLAALLTAPYLAFSLHVAWLGWGRFRRSATKPIDEVAAAAGSVYLALGAAWLFISRAGILLPGFSDSAVLMTALHFQYAGFAACTFTTLTGRLMQERTASLWYRMAAWAVIAGTPAMAIGTALSRWLELAAALSLATGVTIISALALASSRHRPAFLCFSFTAAATVLAMAIAGMYAVTQMAGAFWLPIPQMAIVHGLANAVGFATIGLLAHWLEART